MTSHALANPTMSRPSPVRGARKLGLGALAFLCTLGAATATAHATDLLLLNGDSETISGNVNYGLVYIDGDLRLAGDTTITASSIYIGPDAALITCNVPGVGDNSCGSGRNLSMSASGPLTIAENVNLTGATGGYRPGGNLTLSGGPVVVGDVNTSGAGGAPSGQVSISSLGSLSVGAIDSPGAAVGLTASGAIDVGGDIQTAGNTTAVASDPTRAQSAGEVAVNSTGGDVRIDGTVRAYGFNASTSSGLGGGNGGTVSVLGSNVRTGEIDSYGGNSGAGGPGYPAPISISARDSLQALGQLNASGQNGAYGSSTGGSTVALNASGPLTVGGAVSVNGGQGGGGGSIAMGGQTVTADRLIANGGDAAYNFATGSGGPGGRIAVTAPSGASLGSLLAYGGRAQGAAAPGVGGAITVASTGGPIATGSVQTQGGSPSASSGVNGGPIALTAFGDVAIGGGFDANGSDANGSSNPAFTGGSAGGVTLRATTGTLSFGDNSSAAGGRGGSAATNGAVGGLGGNGGRVLIVAHAIGAVASLSAEGGDGGQYGTTQGPGGAGGSILAFTNSTPFDDQQLVSSDGGDGKPTGPAGAQDQESSPTDLTVSPTTGELSFTPQSPDAQRYRVLMSVAGGAATTALTSTATSGLSPEAPLCTKVSFTVVAVDDSVGWTSDPSPAVSYTRQPSATQGCSAAPKATGSPTTHRTVAQLRRAGWIAAIPVRLAGVGALTATLVNDSSSESAANQKPGHGSHGAPLATVSLTVTRAGTQILRFRIPAGDRLPGTDSVRLVTTAPDGGRHLKTTLTLEIAK